MGRQEPSYAAAVAPPWPLALKAPFVFLHRPGLSARGLKRAASASIAVRTAVDQPLFAWLEYAGRCPYVTTKSIPGSACACAISASAAGRQSTSALVQISG